MFDKYEKVVYNILDLVLRPEKCSICNEWMKVYYTSSNKHDTLERKCNCKNT
jgi:hypothetical protein